MKKIYTLSIYMFVSLILFPGISLAGSVQEKTIGGTITRIDATQITLMDTQAGMYTVQAQNVSLIRRYGTGMVFPEFAVGDKILVTGIVQPNNYISASLIRDMTLYSHNGTFAGKVVDINPPGLSFTIQSKQWGLQTVHTTGASIFKKNTANSIFLDIAQSMSVTVKGSWERNTAAINARQVQMNVRMVDINFNGELMLRGDTALTIIGSNGAIYGADISKATIQNKNNKPIAPNQLTMGGTLRVWGKHISGSLEIVASRIKDMTIIKK